MVNDVKGLEGGIIKLSAPKLDLGERVRLCDYTQGSAHVLQ